MRRKIDSFLNMAAEIGGRGGKGGMVHGVRSLGRQVPHSLSLLGVTKTGGFKFSGQKAQYADLRLTCTNLARP